jgi:hypothetical protein
MQANTATARQIARPWVGPVARIGLATKGIVYLLIGGLAVLAAIGEGGKVDDSDGAVRTIAQLPYGKGLLVCVAIGFLAYAIWRGLQATIDLDRKRGLKGVGKRIAYGVSAIIYLGLAVTAVQLVMGESADGEEPRTWVAKVLAQPYGYILVIGFGIGFAVYGIVHLWSAIKASFEKHLDLGRMSRRERAAALWIGRIGTFARGVVFGIVGYYLIQAGWHSRAGETRDLGGALRTLASKPHGDLILGVIAAGLFMYGVFMLMRAKLGRIPGSDR